MGIFSKLFGNREQSRLTSFADAQVDMHSHLIPGIDDGAKTMEETLALIQGLQAMGFKKIITTPHIMSGGYDNTTNIILSGLANVQKSLKEANLDIPIEAAAEYYLDENFEQLIEKKDLLTIGENMVLFEVSYLFPQSSAKNIVFKLNTSGYRPIMAHPARYPYYHSPDCKKYEEFKDMGCLMQLNISSLSGAYGKPVKQMAERLIDAELIDFIATDLHNEFHFDFLKAALQNPKLDKLVNSGRLKNVSLLSNEN